MGGRVQYILIAAAMMMLSQLSLTVGSSTLSASDTSYGNEAIIAAASIGESVVREVAAKKFDENVIGKKVASTDSLSSVLGPEAGEVYPNFDDVDDFNGHTRTVSADPMGNFTVKVSVSYAAKSPFGTTSATRTYLKAISVTVSGNRCLKDSVVTRSVVTY